MRVGLGVELRVQARGTHLVDVLHVGREPVLLADGPGSARRAGLRVPGPGRRPGPSLVVDRHQGLADGVEGARVAAEPPQRNRTGRQELGPGHPAGVGPVERQQLRQPPTRPELAAGEGVPR